MRRTLSARLHCSLSEFQVVIGKIFLKRCKGKKITIDQHTPNKLQK